MKKYLMIVESPSKARFITTVYSEIREQVSYELDVAVANNHVVNIIDSILENRAELKVLEKLEPVHLKNRKVEECFRIIDNEHYQKNGKIISALVNKNNYDEIINACDDNCEGELIFEHTIESLHLESYQTKRLVFPNSSKLFLTHGLLELN